MSYSHLISLCFYVEKKSFYKKSLFDVSETKEHKSIGHGLAVQSLKIPKFGSISTQNGKHNSRLVHRKLQVSAFTTFEKFTWNQFLMILSGLMAISSRPLRPTWPLIGTLKAQTLLYCLLTPKEDKPKPIFPWFLLILILWLIFNFHHLTMDYLLQLLKT